MDRTGTETLAGSRALEWAIVAIAALLTADAVRSDLGLLWQTLSLLISI